MQSHARSADRQSNAYELFIRVPSFGLAARMSLRTDLGRQAGWGSSSMITG